MGNTGGGVGFSLLSTLGAGSVSGATKYANQVDSEAMSKSRLVPYIPGEHPGERHERRLHTNLRRQELVKDWAHRAGVTLTIYNRGQHWRFTKGKVEAEWWPSSAKLVLQRKYDNDQHIHDHEQAIKVLVKHFTEERSV